MTLPRLPQQSIQLIGLHDFQICKHCRAETPDLVLRHWRFAWTTNCGRCGRFLTSTYRQGGVTKRMQDRAIQGADRLRLAAAKGDQKQLRRFRLTLELLNEVGLVRSSALLSANQSERINALAAIDVGSRRPLLGIAYILKRNSWVVPVLWHAFPRHRRVLKKVLKRERIPLHSFPERRNESQTPKRQAPNPTLPAPSKAALGAARQAVEELGADADRYDLLLRAQEIWQSKAIEQSYPQPVEIS